MLKEARKTIVEATNTAQNESGGLLGLNPEQVQDVAILALLSSVIHIIVGEKCRNCRALLNFAASTTLIALFVGLLTYDLCLFYKLDQQLTVVIVGVAVLIARSIVDAILALGKKIGSNPIKFIQDIKDVLKI